MKLHKYEHNPILSPNPQNAWENFCVLNPGVVYDEAAETFVMLYRAAGDDKEHYIRLGLATSKDGFHFERASDSPVFDVDPSDADGGCIEDPRIVYLDGVYYITYAARPFYAGRYWLTFEEYVREYGMPVVQPESAPHFIKKNSTVSYLAMTGDFVSYKRLGRITDSRFDDRDVLLFPEKINGQYVRISRPKLPPALAAGCKMPSVWISFSDDILEWGAPELLFTGQEWWEEARIGAGCPPLKTEAGWLMLYHGVAATDAAYRVGAVLLDLHDPRRVLARTKQYIMEPEFEYEQNGLYNGCVFPTGNVLKDGIVYVYYGCADKHIAVATIRIEDLLSGLKAV